MTIQMNARLFQDNCVNYLGEVRKVVVGSDEPLWLALVGMFSNGHVLYESVPGMGKTVIAMTLGSAIKDGVAATFQGTADKLPSDLIGSHIFDPATRTMKVKFGAVKPTQNVVLADEINRLAPKTTSALLSVMEERFLLINEDRHDMANPFMLLATENPIEQEGVYPLPEATLDRFAVKGVLRYMSRQHEIDLIKRTAIFERDKAKAAGVQQVLTPESIVAMIEFAKKISITDTVFGYIVDLVRAARPECGAKEMLPAELYKLIKVGPSPRAEIWLTSCSRAAAAIRGSSHVTIKDVQAVAPFVMSHRMILKDEVKYKMGEAGKDADRRIVEHLLKTVPVTGVMSEDVEALRATSGK